jgi:AcrR family transcriptional regulator
MAQKRTSVKAITPRKMPRQKRAEDTVAVIVEAAARILEKNGFEGFNTNAIAEKAGVSIGSLYQYFPSKSALLSALIEREAAPLLDVEKEVSGISECRLAVQCYIRACTRHQMQRPHLARLIDVAEKREMFSEQVLGTAHRLQTVLENIFLLPDAPTLPDRDLAAEDVLALTRGLIDAAGERGEGESHGLFSRVEGAVWGYLNSSSSAHTETMISPEKCR